MSVGKKPRFTRLLLIKFILIFEKSLKTKMTWERILVDQKKLECKQTADGLYYYIYYIYVRIHYCGVAFVLLILLDRAIY